MLSRPGAGSRSLGGSAVAVHGANEDEDQVPCVYNADTDGDSGAPEEGLAERTASAQSCPSRLRRDFVYLLILRHHMHTHAHVRCGRLRVVRSARQRCGPHVQITRRLLNTLCRVLRCVRGCIGGRLTPRRDVADSSCCDACAVSLQDVSTFLTAFLLSPYSLAITLHIFFTSSVNSPRSEPTFLTWGTLLYYYLLFFWAFTVFLPTRVS